MRSTTLATAMVFAAALGCTGKLGDPSGSLPPGPLKEDSGRVTMHRLNRAEYNNTVRDLLGTSQRPADDFPGDDHSYGFDNIADALSIPPSLLDLYERAAEKLALEALALPSLSQVQHTEAEALMGTAGASTGEAWNLWSNGEVAISPQLVAGPYKIRARVWEDHVDPGYAQVMIHVGQQSFGPFDATGTASSPSVIEQDVTIANAGTVPVSVEFINDAYDANLGLDRNLYVDWIEVAGPIGATGVNPLRDRIVICDPSPSVGGEACIKQILTAFTTRAWRRPVSDAEIDALATFVELAENEGDDVNKGLELAVRAALLSPHFIFRAELDPNPSSMTPHPLNDYEIASRLSYFLWSSMPDDALFQAASEGKLANAEEIGNQVDRMLQDPKASAMVDNFAGQWLYLRVLNDVHPDYQKFPEWDETLAVSMREESRLFFLDLLRDDVPVTDLLTAQYTYLNDRLAQHYGLPAVGTEMKRVDLMDGQRGGFLKQGALLTVTSYPTRTSPVKRGKWVLTNLLCSEPPPPPAGVEAIKQEETPTGSLRDRLEEHRKNPTCASCHVTMDDIGFGLEHYSGVGAYRDMDDGFAVDSTGELPGGLTFDGAAEMSALLAKDARLVPCIAKKLLVYGLGRGARAEDKPYLDMVVSDAEKDGMTLKALVKRVAMSEPFRMRRGEGGAP